MELYPSFSVQYGESARTGRPRSLSSMDALGLALVFMASSIPMKHLQLIFGATPAVCSRTLGQACQALQRVLNDREDAQIRWPSPNKIKELASPTSIRCPELPGAFAFMDGFSTTIAASTIQSDQNPYWNGWKHRPQVSCVIVTSTDGLIIWAAINFPGSWHDATIARELFLTLTDNQDLIPERHYILADSAFKRKGYLSDVVRTPMNSISYAKASEEDRAIHRNIVSIRQAAEWAVRDVRRL
jgi:hypothetical protein